MRDMSRVLRNAFQKAFTKADRRTAARPGRLETIEAFESPSLGNSRNITLYLPPGYCEQPDRRYPVLYMQDGQNLFEGDRAFLRGQHWRLREAADAAIAARTAAPMIIVGVDHTGTSRIDEYTPTRDAKRNAGGRAGDYGAMLIGELKPLIDGRYRTLPGRENTAIGGSSLGGLLSLYLALKRSDVFGRAAVMSPSVWWDGRAILREIDRFSAPQRPRLWVDVGGREGEEALADARLLRDRLAGRGWTPASFHYYEDRRGDHSERAWGGRARRVLEFLFPQA